MGLNFRIIKLSEQFINRTNITGNKYRYILSEAYTKLDGSIQMIFIDYCPFCGKELKRTYCSDKYINEANHEW